MTRRSRSRDNDPIEMVPVKGPKGEDLLRVASEEEIQAGIQAEKDEAIAAEIEKNAEEEKKADIEKAKNVEKEKKVELAKTVEEKGKEADALQQKIDDTAAIFDKTKGSITEDRNNQLDFYWVRHGESVANLLNNKITDEYDDKDAKDAKDAITKRNEELKQFIADDYQKVKGMYIPDEDKYDFVLVTKYNKDTDDIKEWIAKLPPTGYAEFMPATAPIIDTKHIYLAIDKTTRIIVGILEGELTAPAAALGAAALGAAALGAAYDTRNITNVNIIQHNKEKEITNMLVKKYILNTYDTDKKYSIKNIPNTIIFNAIYDAFVELNLEQYDATFTKLPPPPIAKFNPSSNYYFKRDNNTLIDPRNYPLVKAMYDYIEKMYDQSTTIVKDKDGKDVCVSYDSAASLNFTGAGDVVNKNCIKIVKDKVGGATGSIRAGYYSYWLKNFLPSNFVFQPTLSGVGQKQAEALGTQLAKASAAAKDIFENFSPLDDNKTVIITSASARAMMTAYLTAQKALSTAALSTAALSTGPSTAAITIYVVPYINEKENDAQFVFDNTNLHDFTNYGIHPDVIEQVGEEIIKKLTAAAASTAASTASSTAAPASNVTFDYSLYTGARDNLLNDYVIDEAEKQKLEKNKTEKNKTELNEAKLKLVTSKTSLKTTVDAWLVEVKKPASVKDIEDAAIKINKQETIVKAAELAVKKAEEDLKTEIENNKYYKAKLSADEQVRQADLTKFFVWFQSSQADSAAPFTDKSQIVAFCHGFVIKELHKITGIDLIKEPVKKIYETYENEKKREMFKTWDANTAVFKHPYFMNSPGGGLLKGLEPITNACLVRNNIELDQVKELMVLMNGLTKVQSEKTKNEKELALIDPTKKTTPQTSGKDMKAIYKYLLDTLKTPTPTPEELQTDIVKLEEQTKNVDALNPEKKTETDEKAKAEAAKNAAKDAVNTAAPGAAKEAAEKTLKAANAAFEKIKAGTVAGSYKILLGVLHADFDKTDGFLKTVYDALKTKYLLIPDKIRKGKSLKAEDKFVESSAKQIISLNPDSLRGIIAKITHGYNDALSAPVPVTAVPAYDVNNDLTDRLLGITFKKAQAIKESALVIEGGGKAHRKLTTHRKLTRRIKKHIKKYTKKNNKKKKQNKSYTKTKKGKKNKKNKYTR